MLFIISTLCQDFGSGTAVSTKPDKQKSPKLKQIPKELFESKDFADEGLYNVFIIPYKFEKLIFIQGLLQTCALIFNLVILPIRVTWSLLKIPLKSIDGPRLTVR